MGPFEYRVRQALADLLYPRGKALREQREREAAEARAEARNLFHRLWGKGHDGPDYSKAEWKRLRALLESFGVDV